MHLGQPIPFIARLRKFSQSLACTMTAERAPQGLRKTNKQDREHCRTTSGNAVLSCWATDHARARPRNYFGEKPEYPYEVVFGKQI